MYSELDYSFCPKCGGPLKKTEKNLLICQKCNYHFYISPKPCNAVILENENGEILLVKRKYSPQKGYWDLPGGFIDINENVEQSVIREIKEELGITISDFKYIASFCDHYEYQNVNLNTVGFVFTGKIINQKIEANDDIEEAQFFDSNKIPEDKIAFPSISKSIQIFLKSKLS